VRKKNSTPKIKKKKGLAIRIHTNQQKVYPIIVSA
jgi:hypothetical protein